MVARVAGAAGPVLLACRQWHPLKLARRRPSRRAGAWVGAPLLPWRVQCPVRVCPALVEGLGGWGRCRVLCLPRSPSPAPRSARCVWRVVPSGCPLPSPAGRPFHAVCAFSGHGPVALLVFPACPLRVCALALSRRPRPSSLSGSAWRAHLAWSRYRAPVGPSPAVRAPPRFLPPSSALSGFLGGAGGPVPFPPCLAWGRVPPSGRVRASGAGGRGLCAVLPGGVAGGHRGAGGRSTSVRPSAFPGWAPKQVLSASLRSWRAWPPYCSGLCSRVDPGCRPRGALVCWRGSACLSWSLWELAGGSVGARGVLA